MEWVGVSPNSVYRSFFPQSQTVSFCLDPECPQQDPFSPQQDSVSISFPLRAAPIIAHAQPTPLWTVIARTGQLRAQAPHSIQADGRSSVTRVLPAVKTAWGQTSVQRPQFMQSSGSKERLVFV